MTYAKNYKNRWMCVKSYSQPNLGHFLRHSVFPAGLGNIMIFLKISKYRKYPKYHDIFDIFDIFQKMKISNKLYNNGCNTLMQYLMTVSYHAVICTIR